MEHKTEYILQELDEIKDNMSQNIHHVVDNMVELDELSNKTENIMQLSETLGKRSRLMKIKEYWRDKRHYFIAGFIIFVLCIIMITVMIISIENDSG
jgi:hypothetical protein